MAKKVWVLRSLLVFLVFSAAAGADISDITVHISESNVEMNLTQTEIIRLTNASNITDAAACAYKYECKATGEGSYWFSCYMDAEGVCRCYKGRLAGCNVSKSSLTMDEWCRMQYECTQRSDGRYWFSCHYDLKGEECLCYVTSHLCGGNVTANETLSNASEPVIGYVAQHEGFFKSATGRVVSAAKWAYKTSVVRIWVPVVAAAALLLVYVFNRDSRANNLRKARKYHNLGESYHNKGKEDKAMRYYELARMLREKVMK